MKNKEKIRELARKHQGTMTDAQYLQMLYALKEMTDCIIEKTIAWMNKHAYDYSFMGDTCIEDYKKAMEE